MASAHPVALARETGAADGAMVQAVTWEGTGRTADSRPGAGNYYRPELDWLRFLAFSMVFALHALPTTAEPYAALGIPRGLAAYTIAPLARAGGYGVDLFFVLSAFLITELLLRERETTGRVHVGSFYLRRVLRIWPLYMAYILAVLPYEAIRKDIPVSYYLALLAFTGNWYIVLFGGFPSLCGHLWTVCVEEQFYLVWPNLVGRVKSRHFAWILAGALCCACVFRFFYVRQASTPLSVWYHTLTRLDGFALGGLLAWALHGRTLRLPVVARLGLFASAVALFWTVGRTTYGGYFGALPVWTYPLAAGASGLLLLAFLGFRPQGPPARPLRMLSYLGKISYGLYVFHVPALRLASLALGSTWPSPRWSWVFRMAAGALITLVVAALSYALLERPFLRLKRRFTFVASRPD
jgi:peptidoglycan/LPS O-acetylase OafA/YrhL